jgi:hypothetical protein
MMGRLYEYNPEDFNTMCQPRYMCTVGTASYARADGTLGSELMGCYDSESGVSILVAGLNSLLAKCTFVQ